MVPEGRMSGEAVLDQNCFVWLPGVDEVVDEVVCFLAVGVGYVGHC